MMMIAQLRGILLNVFEQGVVLEVCGVGYRVFVPKKILPELQLLCHATDAGIGKNC